jgi:hypothetical protein
MARPMSGCNCCRAILQRCSGGCSSVGRVQDCDSCCRGFEPHQPPQVNQLLSPTHPVGLCCFWEPCSHCVATSTGFCLFWAWWAALRRGVFSLGVVALYPGSETLALLASTAVVWPSRAPARRQPESQHAGAHRKPSRAPARRQHKNLGQADARQW